MSDNDTPKFDSNDEYRIAGVRLSKDPRVLEGANGKMVSLSFASNSRRDRYSTLWVNANVADFNSEVASFLKKGDTLHEIKGKPVLRMWGDNNEKASFELDRATLVIPFELFAELKTRGFVPGAGKAAKPPAKGKVKRPIVDIDDED